MAVTNQSENVDNTAVLSAVDAKMAALDAAIGKLDDLSPQTRRFN
jgi:hypothetical protein